MLGSASGKERFADAAKLLDDGFANYAMVKPELPEGAVTELPVRNGMCDKVGTTADVSHPLLMEKGSGKQLKAEVILPQELEAPIVKGAVVGQILYKSGGKQIAEYPIAAAEDVKEINFGDVFGMLMGALSG